MLCLKVLLCPAQFLQSTLKETQQLWRHEKESFCCLFDAFSRRMKTEFCLTHRWMIWTRKSNEWSELIDLKSSRSTHWKVSRKIKKISLTLDSGERIQYLELLDEKWKIVRDETKKNSWFHEQLIELKRLSFIYKRCDSVSFCFLAPGFFSLVVFLFFVWNATSFLRDRCFDLFGHRSNISSLA